MHGLHRFEKASNAFLAIEGGYGEQYEGYGEILILTDYEFQRAVFERFCLLCMAKKTGYGFEGDIETVETAFNYVVPTKENGMRYNDYFTDFNYFLASSWNGCFYTCLMSFKDDGASDFDEEQWDIASNLILTYNLTFIWEQAQRIVLFNDDIDCLDSLNNYMIDNELFPFQVTDYCDLTEQLTDILNKEIKEELN